MGATVAASAVIANQKEHTISVTKVKTESGLQSPVHSQEKKNLDVSQDNGKVDDGKNIQKLGLMCVSPGLDKGRMDNKMLSTIETSKSIEKNQNETIINTFSPKSRHNLETQLSETQEQEDMFIDEETENTAPDSNSKPSSNTNCLKKSSIKRKNIPSPLKLQKADGGFGAGPITAGPPNTASAAKFNRVTKHTLHKKPRVHYLGTSNTLLASKGMNYNPQQSLYNSRVRTPYNPQMMMDFSMTPYSQFSPYPFQQMYRPRMSTSGSMSGNPYVFPKTAVPYSNHSLHYRSISNFNPSTMTNNDMPRRRSSYAMSANGDAATVKPSTELNENIKETEEDDEDDESTQLAIDAEDEKDSVSPKSATVPSPPVQGAIRIGKHVFGFEFSLLSSQVDKKMFMNICDKVWDDAQLLMKKDL